MNDIVYELYVFNYIINLMYIRIYFYIPDIFNINQLYYLLYLVN